MLSRQHSQMSVDVRRPRAPITRNTYSDEALQVFLTANGVTSEDNRGKNGALWVNLDDERSESTG